MGSLSNHTYVLDEQVEMHGAKLTTQIHQFLAPLLSVILTVPLGPHPPSSSTPKPDAFDIRSRAADVLGKITSLYGPKYPSLSPRTYSYTLYTPALDADS